MCDRASQPVRATPLVRRHRARRYGRVPERAGRLPARVAGGSEQERRGARRTDGGVRARRAARAHRTGRSRGSARRRHHRTVVSARGARVRRERSVRYRALSASARAGGVARRHARVRQRSKRWCESRPRVDGRRDRNGRRQIGRVDGGGERGRARRHDRDAGRVRRFAANSGLAVRRSRTDAGRFVLLRARLARRRLRVRDRRCCRSTDRNCRSS